MIPSTRLAQPVRALGLQDQLVVKSIVKNTKKIGNLTELQCATRLYELNCAVSIPFGNSEKYDLIIDWDNKLYKVQIKHANVHYDENQNEDYFTIECRWHGHNMQGYTHNKYTEQDVDFFATFYNNECYLIPLKECSNLKTLRIKPPKNNQKNGICFLEDYKASEVLKQL